MRNLLKFVLLIALAGCSAKEPIEFRRVEQIELIGGEDPILHADAVFYNPNGIRGKLRHIKINIFVNEQLAGIIDQDPALAILPRAEFKVPLDVNLQMKQSGLLESILGMIANNRVKINFRGSINVSYHGVPAAVPIDYATETSLR